MQNDQLESERYAAKYPFVVTMGITKMHFQEVTGLNNETDLVEHRSGNSKFNSSRKVSDLKKQGRITLKRGLIKKGKPLSPMNSDDKGGHSAYNRDHNFIR